MKRFWSKRLSPTANGLFLVLLLATTVRVKSVPFALSAAEESGCKVSKDKIVQISGVTPAPAQSEPSDRTDAPCPPANQDTGEDATSSTPVLEAGNRDARIDEREENSTGRAPDIEVERQENSTSGSFVTNTDPELGSQPSPPPGGPCSGDRCLSIQGQTAEPALSTVTVELDLGSGGYSTGSDDPCNTERCSFELTCPSWNPERFVSTTWYHIRDDGAKVGLFRLSNPGSSVDYQRYPMGDQLKDTHSITGAGNLNVTGVSNCTPSKFVCARSARVGHRNEDHLFVVAGCEVTKHLDRTTSRARGVEPLPGRAAKNTAATLSVLIIAGAWFMLSY